MIPPAQYTYEYSVEDLAGNIATETVLINVVMRKYELYTGVELDTAQYNNATYVEEYKEEVATQYAETARTTQNFIFRGVGDVEFSNRVDDTNTGNTTFDLKVTYFELPEGFDADPSSTATGRRRSARRRSLLQSNLGSPSSSGTSSPTVDENAAVVASIKGEINAIAALLDGSTSDLQAVVTDLGVAGGNPAAYQQRVGDYWGTLLRVADDSFRDLQNQAQDTLRVLDSTISVQQQVLESVAELEILLKKQNDELKATLDAIGEGEGDALGARASTDPGWARRSFSSTPPSTPIWVRRRPPRRRHLRPRFLRRHRRCRLHLNLHLRLHPLLEAAVASCRKWRRWRQPSGTRRSAALGGSSWLVRAPPPPRRADGRARRGSSPIGRDTTCCRAG